MFNEILNENLRVQSFVHGTSHPRILHIFVLPLLRDFQKTTFPEIPTDPSNLCY